MSEPGISDAEHQRDVARLDHAVNANHAVYYGDDYWNNLPEVAAWLNRKASGDTEVYWGAQFRATVDRTFKRALILNCGDGNVERGLLEHDVMEEGVGVDYSEELLGRARAAATAADLPLEYVQRDVNGADLPLDGVDLVVNHAAAHHIAYLDRVFRRLCEALPEDGCFVSHDYVGPHRNQYPWEAWDAAATLNRSLPDRFRQHLHYPHLPTMLELDPTEAIHSELVLATMRRYFHLDEVVPLGGAIAYQLLTHNELLFAAPDDDPERAATIRRILDADDAFTAAAPEDSWFVYVVARPNKAVLEDQAQLDAWTAEEEAREDAARADGGEYYPHTTLQELILEAEDWRATAHRVQRWADDLQASYDRVMALPPYRQARWIKRKLDQRRTPN